jgi:hypothetical protein
MCLLSIACDGRRRILMHFENWYILFIFCSFARIYEYNIAKFYYRKVGELRL